MNEEGTICIDYFDDEGDVCYVLCQDRQDAIKHYAALLKSVFAARLIGWRYADDPSLEYQPFSELNRN